MKMTTFTSDNSENYRNTMQLMEKDKLYENHDNGKKLAKGTDELSDVLYETSDTEKRCRDSQSLTDGFGIARYCNGYYISDDGDDSDSDSKSASY